MMTLPLYDPAKIDTATKRAGYLAFIAGLAAAVLSLLWFLIAEHHIEFYRELFSRRFSYRLDDLIYNWSGYGVKPYRFFCYGGLALAALGWLFSFGYERTVGKFASWIQTGQT